MIYVALDSNTKQDLIVTFAFQCGKTIAKLLVARYVYASGTTSEAWNALKTMTYACSELVALKRLSSWMSVSKLWWVLVGGFVMSTWLELPSAVQ